MNGRHSTSVDDYLRIDLLTLRSHTESAGDRLDAEVHRARLITSLAISQVCEVRRDGQLVAYAMLRPDDGDRWFVTAFNIDPDHRNPAVFAALARTLLIKIDEFGIAALRSHVYRTNAPSMGLHRRLGFQITRESDKGVEFQASIGGIIASPLAAWIRRQKTDIEFQAPDR
jgi:ribosomal protein S18 acetylase RimI-like enzyme